MKTPTVANPIYVPTAKYLNITNPLIKGSSFFLGGFFITSGSGGLKERAVAGKPSVTKLTHKS